MWKLKAKMGPKPVRIGLKRNAPFANDEFSDEALSVADQDEILPPLTFSAIKELEKIVELDDDSSSIEDIFPGEVDLDNDPHYVPIPVNVPGTAKGKALAKPTNINTIVWNKKTCTQSFS